MSARARGRHTGRPATTDQQDDQARNIGASPRTQGVPSPIPGGRPHLTNPESPRIPVPSPAPRGEYRGTMAHGVPAETHTTRERAEFMRGPRPEGLVGHSEEKEPVVPVPVYLVERTGPKVVRTTSPRHITVPANSGADPVRVCGVDFGRVKIGILNESTSMDIRFAQRVSDLTNGGGALLPWPSNAYVWLETQDELYALSAGTASALLSIVDVHEQQW